MADNVTFCPLSWASQPSCTRATRAIETASSTCNAPRSTASYKAAVPACPCFLLRNPFISDDAALRMRRCDREKCFFGGGFTNASMYLASRALRFSRSAAVRSSNDPTSPFCCRKPQARPTQRGVSCRKPQARPTQRGVSACNDGRASNRPVCGLARPWGQRRPLDHSMQDTYKRGCDLGLERALRVYVGFCFQPLLVLEAGTGSRKARGVRSLCITSDGSQLTSLRLEASSSIRFKKSART